MRTIADINPSKIFLLDSDYKALKKAVRHRSQDGSFPIVPGISEQHLTVLNLIKKQTRRVRDPDDIFATDETGLYELTIDGEYYLQYRTEQFWKSFNSQFRWIITTVISVLALLISAIALLMQGLHQ